MPRRQKDGKCMSAEKSGQEEPPKKTLHPTLRLRLRCVRGPAAQTVTPGERNTLPDVDRAAAMQTGTAEIGSEFGNERIPDSTAQALMKVSREDQIRALAAKYLKNPSAVGHFEEAAQAPVRASNEPPTRRARVVKFDSTARESNPVPQGKPCCVHPKLLKAGKGTCFGAACRDLSISLEEVEELLGIDLAEYVTDEQFARMSERAAESTAENSASVAAKPMGVRITSPASRAPLDTTSSRDSSKPATLPPFSKAPGAWQHSRQLEKDEDEPPL